MPDTLLDHCNPRVIKLPSTADGSLTKATIKGITPAELVDLETKGVGEIQSVWYGMMRAKMHGVKEHNLFDLLMSRTTSIKAQLNKQTIGNQSYFLPYVMRRQENVVNANAFVITGGIASANAGSTVGGIYYPTHAWEITVENSPSPYQSAIENIERYFLKGAGVVVLNLSGGGAAQSPYYTVVNSENVDADTAKVTLAPNYTEAGWAALGAPAQAVYQPTAGVVQIGVNAVSDYESWCENQPAELGVRVLHYWLETNRYVETYDEDALEYLKKIKAGEVNAYLDLYRNTDVAEFNRRQRANYERAVLNDFFYKDRINENQTAEGYQNLPQVTGQFGEFLEYKAHALGIRTLLNDCGRVIDYAGGALDINALAAQLYSIKRHREAEGGQVQSIDIMGGHLAALNFDSVMMSYYKARNRTDFRQTWEPQKIADGHLWEYRTYDIPEARVKVNFIIDPFFDDDKGHYTGALVPRGNKMAVLDWPDIEYGVAGTASRNSHTPDLETDSSLSCVIKTNRRIQKMQSEMRTAILEDPARHLWVENFSDACPTYNYTNCDATAV